MSKGQSGRESPRGLKSSRSTRNRIYGRPQTLGSSSSGVYGTLFDEGGINQPTGGGEADGARSGKRTSRALRPGWSVRLRWSLRVGVPSASASVRALRRMGEPSEAGRGRGACRRTGWLMGCVRGSLVSCRCLQTYSVARWAYLGLWVRRRSARWGNASEVHLGSPATAPEFVEAGLGSAVLCHYNCPVLGGSLCWELMCLRRCASLGACQTGKVRFIA